MTGCAPIVTLALLWLSMGITAEALQTAPSALSKVSSATVTVTGQDNGQDVDLTTGGILIVKLKSNPSTGYSWTVSGDPSPLRLEKTTYVKNSQSSKAVGAPGMQVLRFGVSSSGMATLTVVYRRSWEYNEPPAKTFRVRVNVR